MKGPNVHNSIFHKHGTERGARRHNGGFLRGGPAAAGPSPFLFLSGQAWAAELGLGGWLAGWTADGAALAGCWVGPILGWLEAAAELGRLGRKCRIAWDDLFGYEAFSEALYFRSKQAGGGDRGVKEGDLIHILHLCQVQPQIALELH